AITGWFRDATVGITAIGCNKVHRIGYVEIVKPRDEKCCDSSWSLDVNGVRILAGEIDDATRMIRAAIRWIRIAHGNRSGIGRGQGRQTWCWNQSERIGYGSGAVVPATGRSTIEVAPDPTNRPSIGTEETAGKTGTALAEVDEGGAGEIDSSGTARI